MASAARPWPEQVGGIAEPAETGLEPSGRSGQHSTAGIAPACAGGSTPAPHRRASTRADTLSASADDLAQGQIVVVVARWILVLAGLVLALWNPAPIDELRAQVAAVLLLAVANFYLTALLAFSVAFPARTTLVFTGAALAFYGLICLFTLERLATDQDVLAVVSRLIMLAAVPLCGSVYQRV